MFNESSRRGLPSIRPCLVTVLVWLSLSGVAQATECNTEQAQRAQTLADAAAQSLVPDRFLGGKDITAVTRGCDIDDAEVLTIEIDIKWKGLFFSNNEYEVWGEARSNWIGDQSTFVLVGASDKTQELVFWGELAGKVIEIRSGKAN